LDSDHGNTLLDKAIEMIHRGESTFTNNHHYCSVFDEKRNKNLIIKFYVQPAETVPAKKSDNNFVDHSEGLYD
jgi:hypothetical protein